MIDFGKQKFAHENTFRNKELAYEACFVAAHTRHPLFLNLKKKKTQSKTTIVKKHSIIIITSDSGQTKVG